MKDYFGQELKEGDYVVMMQLGYRNLIVGQIARLTPKTAMVSHPVTNICSKESKQFHNQLIKITEEQYLYRLAMEK